MIAEGDVITVIVRALVQTAPEGWTNILFGDLALTDYAFSAEVKVDQGTSQRALIFRSAEPC